MTGPRAAELNGALARVRGEKRSLLFIVPESRALEPYVEENHVNSDDRLAVELESGNQSSERREARLGSSQLPNSSRSAASRTRQDRPGEL